MTLDPKLLAAFNKGPPKEPLLNDITSMVNMFSVKPPTEIRYAGFDAEGVGPAAQKTTP